MLLNTGLNISDNLGNSSFFEKFGEIEYLDFSYVFLV